MVKLYEIKRGSKIYSDENITVGDKEYEDAVIIFDHLDGMYSYCTLEDKEGDRIIHKDGSTAVMHLQAATPLLAHKDGYKIDWGK